MGRSMVNLKNQPEALHDRFHMTSIVLSERPYMSAVVEMGEIATCCLTPSGWIKLVSLGILTGDGVVGLE